MLGDLDDYNSVQRDNDSQMQPPFSAARPTAIVKERKKDFRAAHFNNATKTRTYTATEMAGSSQDRTTNLDTANSNAVNQARNENTIAKCEDTKTNLDAANSGTVELAQDEDKTAKCEGNGTNVDTANNGTVIIQYGLIQIDMWCIMVCYV